MVRLAPDEPLGALAPASPLLPSSLSRPNSRPSSGKSGLSGAQMARLLPDEPLTPGGTMNKERRGSNSTGSAHSMGLPPTPTSRNGAPAVSLAGVVEKPKPSMRLPDEAFSAFARQPSQVSFEDASVEEAPSKGSKEESGRSSKKLTPPSASKSAMRERLAKNLHVSTRNPDKPSKAEVFRQLSKSESIKDHYEFAEEVYNGGSKGKVMVGKCKATGAEVVVKIRSKRGNKGGERTWREIMAQMSKMSGHRHVLDIQEILEDDKSFYIVMPKCNGGELFEFLVTETEVPEAECKRIIREILVAVGHLHKGGLVHRDVKPENIMFDTPLPVAKSAKTPKTVKLIDFDTCVEWTPMSPKSSRFVGTPGYIAPEALLGEITPQSDLWSIGVILYILMTGETPWSSLASLEDGTVGSPGAKKMYNALKAEVLEWDKEPWPEFPQAKDLCQRLMAFNTEERPPSVQEALEHPWLKDLAHAGD